MDPTDFSPDSLLTRRSFLVRAGQLSAAGALAGAMAPGVALGSIAAEADRIGHTTLTFVGWEPEDGYAALPAFRKKYGITLRSTYMSSADELLIKFQSSPGQLDFVSNNKDYINALMQSGRFLAPFDLSKLPNMKDIYPAFKRLDPPWTQKNGQTYAIPIQWGDAPVVYDPSKWDEHDGVPDRYEAFASKKYRNSLVTYDDPVTNIWLISKTLGHNPPTHITQKQMNDVIKLFREIMKNVVTIAQNSGSDVADALVTGPASIAFNGWEAFVGFAAKKGKVLKFATPKTDGTYWWVDTLAMAKGTHSPDTVHFYINELISPQGNAKVADSALSGSVNSKSRAYQNPKYVAYYPYHLLSGPSANPTALTVPLFPPFQRQGNILSSADWTKAWQEIRT